MTKCNSALVVIATSFMLNSLNFLFGKFRSVPPKGVADVYEVASFEELRQEAVRSQANDAEVVGTLIGTLGKWTGVPLSNQIRRDLLSAELRFRSGRSPGITTHALAEGFNQLSNLLRAPLYFGTNDEQINLLTTMLATHISELLYPVIEAEPKVLSPTGAMFVACTLLRQKLSGPFKDTDEWVHVMRQISSAGLPQSSNSKRTLVLREVSVEESESQQPILAAFTTDGLGPTLLNAFGILPQ